MITHHLDKKLYMIMLGCTPKGRFTEQHDIFFGIANCLKDLIPEINSFWPEANGKIHIDAWREVNRVGDFKISVTSKLNQNNSKQKLFFINLGGYQKDVFDELHEKHIIVANSQPEAIKNIKKTIFYKEKTFQNASSHIDNKYGLDVDEIFKIEDILNPVYQLNYSIIIEEHPNSIKDEIHLGYLPLKSIK